MRFCRYRGGDGTVRVGILHAEGVVPLEGTDLTSLLLDADPVGYAEKRARWDRQLSADSVQLLAPLEDQEVWAAGVTYKRSEEARKKESEGAAIFYEKVYHADRPELFLKATRRRVVGPGGKVRIRSDTDWCVPEPELAVFVRPDGSIAAYSLGDDVSCRDIEGENPLYLPQAKIFDDCCALGPVWATPDEVAPLASKTLTMQIWRDGTLVYTGSTGLDRMARSPAELAEWLLRDQSFPNGVVLLTGTGIVPPDEFSLRPGDVIRILMDPIGVLETSCYRGS